MASKRTGLEHGFGSVYTKRSGRIVAEAQVDGARRFFYSDEHGDTFKDEKTARAFLRHLHENRRLAEKPPTLSAFLDDWLAYVEKSDRRHSTYRRCESDVRLYLKPSVGAKRLDALTAADIQRFIGELRAKGLAPYTQRRRFDTLRTALRKAVQWGLIERDPCRGVETPSGAMPEAGTLTPEQLAAFIAALIDHPLRAFYLSALYTGLRRGELLAMQWADLDLDSRWLKVRGNWQEGPDGWERLAPKTDKSRRTVPLAEVLVVELRAHAARQALLRRMGGEEWQEGDYVFTRANGLPLSASMIQRSTDRLLRQIGAKADGQRRGLHLLRHSFASMLLREEGITVKVVQDLLGHTKAATTLDIYTHVLPDQKSAAVEKLAKRLGSDPV